MQRKLSHPYVMATVWAVMLILSSWLLRGNSAGDWVDAVLYLVAGVWLASTSTMRRPRLR